MSNISIIYKIYTGEHYIQMVALVNCIDGYHEKYMNKPLLGFAPAYLMSCTNFNEETEFWFLILYLRNDIL